ncbi:MAG: prepilin-type N-terminal cleavage/methylation domain-containing protein [Nitrospirae bacterium]|nr:prepilin-type N-terminal cleavage/methylation domain-containing protein [Nitrospirota bacterium]
MREQKGFTLIELAIVLVIIGIIIGAVLKGQDLIESARIKKFDNSVREWETAVWTYIDRKGQFPGDSDKDGIIGNTGATPTVGDDIRAAGFINEPDENPVTIGSLNFWVQFGNDGQTPPKNIMAICANADCSLAFTADQLKYVESLDTVIDGTSNGTGGNVISVTSIVTAQLSAGPDDLIIPARVEIVEPAPENTSEDRMITGINGVEAEWSTDSVASVYYFDNGKSDLSSEPM